MSFRCVGTSKINFLPGCAVRRQGVAQTTHFFGDILFLVYGAKHGLRCPVRSQAPASGAVESSYFTLRNSFAKVKPGVVRTSAQSTPIVSPWTQLPPSEMGFFDEGKPGVRMG
jgi:hypothetical protein